MHFNALNPINWHNTNIDVDASGSKLEDTPIIKPLTVPEVDVLNIEPIDSIWPYKRYLLRKAPIVYPI